MLESNTETLICVILSLDIKPEGGGGEASAPSSIFYHYFPPVLVGGFAF